MLINAQCHHMKALFMRFLSDAYFSKIVSQQLQLRNVSIPFAEISVNFGIHVFQDSDGLY